jgi:EAL and modified HD-GYP domain-containing signal transduction protein
MAAVQDPNISIDRLADLANTDPSLAYRLLWLLNVSANGLTESVRSVRHAIVLLGINHVRELATMLAMTANAADNRELITLALTRAHMLRQLFVGQPEADDAFTAGLLSVIDALFGTPMSELLVDLPVSEDVREALLSHSGPIGEVLSLVCAFEQDEVLDSRHVERFGLRTIGAAFAIAVASAAQLDRQLDLLEAIPV